MIIDQVVNMIIKANTLLVKIMVGMLVVLHALAGFIVSEFYSELHSLHEENKLYDAALQDIQFKLIHLEDEIEMRKE